MVATKYAPAVKDFRAFKSAVSLKQAFARGAGAAAGYFRAFKSAVSLKQVDFLPIVEIDTEFPRLQKRGLIEARRCCVWCGG